MSESNYKKAGVDIDQGNKAVENIKSMVSRMGVNEIGKFGGFFPLKHQLENPVLVSSADGVGTKLKIAFLMDKHETIGKDLVNHCVNDILVYGASPLFFLDYIATGKLKSETVSAIVSGILEGCLDNSFVLLGGETAEMPGFYQDSEYDVAGFIVGLVEQKKITDGKNIQAGDLIIGFPSSGLHTNGYSLARYICFEKLKLTIDATPDGLTRMLGEELLETHLSYLKPVQNLLKSQIIKGMAHITGGGLLENIPRILPDGLAANIEKGWPVPDIFQFLVDAGKVNMDERYRVFNMGIGYICIIDKNHLGKLDKILKSKQEPYYLIGQIVPKQGVSQVKIN